MGKALTNFSINTIFRIFGTAAALVLLPVLINSNAQAADIVLDEITAVVNEGVVLRSEVAAEMRFLSLQAKAAGQKLPQDEVLESRVLERLITQELQRQRAEHLGIDVDQASVNDAIDRIAASNKLKTFEFRQALQQEGFDYNYYRASIRHELLLNRLIQREVEQSINVSEQEVDEYLSSTSPAAEDLVYRLRHILIAVPSSETDEKIAAAKARMDKAIRQIKNGENFADIAARVSDGRRALEGGDLGWRKLSELPRFLHEAVKNTNTGDISEAVQSPDGFHLIKIEQQQTRETEKATETLLRHIFIADSDNASAEQTLKQLKARIAAGESFAELAAEYSQDPNSSGNGGELPWAINGELPAEMQEVADKLQAGTLSDTFHTRYGWHILEVLDRRKASSSDTKRRREAELNLRQRKLEQETERWSRRMRDEAFVELKG